MGWVGLRRMGPWPCLIAEPEDELVVDAKCWRWLLYTANDIEVYFILSTSNSRIDTEQ